MQQYATTFIVAIFTIGLALSGAVDGWAGVEFLKNRNSNPFFTSSMNSGRMPFVGANRPFTRTFLGYFPDVSQQQQLASRQVIYGDGEKAYAFNRQPSLWRYAEPTKRIPFEDFARNHLAMQQQQQQQRQSQRFALGEPWDIFSHILTDPASGTTSAEGQRCTADKQCGADMECVGGVVKSSSNDLLTSSSADAMLLGAKKKREDEKTCQPIRRDRSKLQFNDDCNSSDECDMARGLCCQSIRLVRQAPRQVCLYAVPRHADELCLFQVL